MSHKLTTDQHSEANSVKPVKKKKKTNFKKKKKSERYCTCRRGYDGKEFMIECDGCKEWFHGECIGVAPNTVTDQYYCQSCRKKKTLIILKPAKKATLPSPPAVQSVAVTSIERENNDDDDDDICILCDGECTCRQNPSLITRPLTPPKLNSSPQHENQFVFNQTVKNTSDDEEDIVVDDLDDLLEAMSPLSTNHTDGSLSENEELFTDDDQDMVQEETQQLIDDFMSGDEDDEEGDDNSDENDQEIPSNLDYTFVEDNYEDEQLPDGYSYYRRWSSSFSDEEEDVEFDFTQDVATDGSEEEETNQILDDNLYSNITSAFIHALAPSRDGSASTGANTPILNEDRPLSSQELSNILSSLSAEQRNEDISRRPSLPSSALSAARRLRGSIDLNSSEALRALSMFGLPLSTLEEQKEEARDESKKSDLHEKILSMLTIKDENAASILSPTSGIHSPLSTLNTLLSDETSSAKQTYLSSVTAPEQLNLNDASLINKRKATNTTGVISTGVNEKKRRTSRSNSFSAFQKRLEPLEFNSFSTPVSPTAIMADPFEDIQFDEEMLTMPVDDTSQLYTSPELEQDPDLSRWQRIPIGAFRSMRSKNKLWLER